MSWLVNRGGVMSWLVNRGGVIWLVNRGGVMLIDKYFVLCMANNVSASINASPFPPIIYIL